MCTVSAVCDQAAIYSAAWQRQLGDCVPCSLSGSVVRIYEGSSLVVGHYFSSVEAVVWNTSFSNFLS